MAAETVKLSPNQSQLDRSPAEMPPTPVLLRLPEIRGTIGQIPEVPTVAMDAPEAAPSTTDKKFPPSLWTRLQGYLASAVSRASHLVERSGKYFAVGLVILLIAFVLAIYPWLFPQQPSPPAPDLPVNWEQTVDADGASAVDDAPMVVFEEADAAELPLASEPAMVDTAEPQLAEAPQLEPGPPKVEAAEPNMTASDDVSPLVGPLVGPANIAPEGGVASPSRESLEFASLQNDVPLPAENRAQPLDAPPAAEGTPGETAKVSQAAPSQVAPSQVGPRHATPLSPAGVLPPSQPQVPQPQVPQPQSQAPASDIKSMYRDTGFPEFAPPTMQSLRGSRSASRNQPSGTAGGRTGSPSSETQRHERSGSSLY